MINKICVENLVSNIYKLKGYACGASSKYLQDLASDMFHLLDNLENMEYGKIKDKKVVNIKDYKKENKIFY